MTEDKRQPSVFRRIAVIFTAGLTCIFLVFYFVLALMSPSRKISQIQQEYDMSVADAQKISGQFLSDSSYISLLRQKSFFESRMAMAATDSLSLSLDLQDSIAAVEINGVAVHRSKIERFKVSRLLTRADLFSVVSMLSRPLNITGDISTIEKEPVMIKIAPRDTSEYQPDILPDTTIQKIVSFMFQTDCGIRIYVYGTDDISGKTPGFFRFDLSDRFRNTLNTARNMMELRVPDYYPAIRIWLDRSDARIIYRALPRYGQVALRL